MKKYVSVLLAIIMIISGCYIVFADSNGSMENFKRDKAYVEGQFTDVSSLEWYAENVKIAYELSLVNGTSSNTFSPDLNLTIAEAITLASRMNNIYYGNTYSFVIGDVWYQTYVDYAVEKGIIKNNQYSDFDAYATRSQFAQIFSLALPSDALQVINQVDNNAIPDVPANIGYSNAVYKLYRAGILTGNDEKGTFEPDTFIQRSAVSAIVSRMANVNLRQKINLITDKEENKNYNKKLTSEEISEKCSSAVFYIESYAYNGKASKTGSGFFVTSDGVAVTNYHVVEDSMHYKIITADGKSYDKVSIIDSDGENDLALLRIEGSDFPYLEMGDSALVKQGQRIYAIGSPLGLSNTMSQGIISNTSRIIEDTEYIQISVPINHGSSGGALIDEYGNVIGITSGGFETTGDLNLAIPINKTKTLNFNSTDSYELWSGKCYPGFSQVLDFETFSGVKLISLFDTPISYDEEYDLLDFHAVGSYDASYCFGSTFDSYGDALEEMGMTEKIIGDFETVYESDSESVTIKIDFDSEKIFISALRKPIFYDEFSYLPDFGWYSNMPMATTPQHADDSIIYSYKWSDYYYESDYEEILYYYLRILEELGYEYKTTETTEDFTGYLHEGNGLSIVTFYSDTEMYIDVCKI